MKNQEIFSSLNGSSIPVTVDLNVLPLEYNGKVVTNGRGEMVTNDKWIYVRNRGTSIAINVNRSQYCEMVYMSNVSISSQGKLTKNLQEFVTKVADRLIFQKDGITYRVFLKKTPAGMDIDCVKLYWIINHSPNLAVNELPERYRSIVVDGNARIAYDLKVDLHKAFNF